MGFNVYQAIQEHAQNGAPTAAGNLHEEIWTEVLTRTQPKFHNARVTRGDGGIDGICFVDAATGEATVYQAKFFVDLKDDSNPTAKSTTTNVSQAQKTKSAGHRGQVVDAFVTALGHSFVCSTWVLLLPTVLSHTDMNWLMAEMKAEAKTEASARMKMPADIERRIDSCKIEFKDGDDLRKLLERYLDVAARHLPYSSLALAEELAAERTARARERSDSLELLATLRDDSIRNRQAETRRARAGMSILNQGWANLVGKLNLIIVGSLPAQNDIAELAAEIEYHAADRASHAYACEGLVPGVSVAVSDIHHEARRLQLATLTGLSAPASLTTLAQKLRLMIQKLQRDIGEVSGRLDK